MKKVIGPVRVPQDLHEGTHIRWASEGNSDFHKMVVMHLIIFWEKVGFTDQNETYW